jgi:hypothetical protein
MAAAGRAIEIALGLFFIGTAAMKALDVDAFAKVISAYNVVRDPDLVRAAAYGTLALETFLGACFLARWRLKGAVYGLAVAVTVVFSGLIAYAWRYHGLEDCGCFGEMITMGPAASILKNVILMCVLAGTWLLVRAQPAPVGEARRVAPRVATAAVATLLVGGLTAYSTVTSAPAEHIAPTAQAPRDKPFAKFQFEYEGKAYNLGEGEYVVAFLSASCSHCRESVQYLNEYVIADGLPEFLALMQVDSPEVMEEFALETMPLFPTQAIDDLVFMDFLRELSHPPRLSYVSEGREELHWAWEEGTPPPTPEELRTAIGPADAVGN